LREVLEERNNYSIEAFEETSGPRFSTMPLCLLINFLDPMPLGKMWLMNMGAEALEALDTESVIL